jgi:hypothetical protein
MFTIGHGVKNPKDLVLAVSPDFEQCSIPYTTTS